MGSIASRVTLLLLSEETGGLAVRFEVMSAELTFLRNVGDLRKAIERRRAGFSGLGDGRESKIMMDGRNVSRIGLSAIVEVHV